MKTARHVQLILVTCLATWPAVAQQNGKSWFKGNLHAHSYWSDGDEFPETIMDWYKSHGYHFVGLSDHNTLAGGEKWKKITRSNLYEESFNRYLQKYGTDWVQYIRSDSGRITVKLKTYQEYKPLFEDKNFLIIQSEEITSRFGDKPIHINATNIQTVLPPQQGESVSQIIQRTIDAVLQQREQTGVPMFPHINHPNFYWGVSVDDIIGVRGERFFEVYNGHPLVHNYGDSQHSGMEELWDRVNVAYLKKGQPVMYGLGTDDSHNYHQFGAAYSNAGRGWVMVRAVDLSAASLIKAMEAGDFYASTGVLLDELETTGERISIKVHPESGITYAIEFIGVERGKEQTKVIHRVNGPSASFKITSQYQFVRARITSTKSKVNPFQEGDYEMAWTQPVTPGQK